jgi:hypothetical protein
VVVELVCGFVVVLVVVFVLFVVVVFNVSVQLVLAAAALGFHGAKMARKSPLLAHKIR